MSTLHTCLNGNCNSPICLKIIRQWVLPRATTYFAKIKSVVRASRNARQIWKSQSEMGVTSFCTFLRRSWFMHWLDSNHGWNIFVRWQDTKAWITVLIYIYVATLFLCGHSLVYFCHTPVIRILVLLTEKNLPCWGQFFFFFTYTLHQHCQHFKAIVLSLISDSGGVYYNNIFSAVSMPFLLMCKFVIRFDVWKTGT